jgi:hypothetical protein
MILEKVNNLQFETGENNEIIPRFLSKCQSATSMWLLVILFITHNTKIKYCLSGTSARGGGVLTQKGKTNLVGMTDDNYSLCP